MKIFIDVKNKNLKETKINVEDIEKVFIVEVILKKGISKSAPNFNVEVKVEVKGFFKKIENLYKNIKVANKDIV